MKRIIIGASVVIVLLLIPIFAFAQDNWGRAMSIDMPSWYECGYPVLYGFTSPTISSNDSLMFLNSMGFGVGNIAYSLFRDNAWQCPVLLPDSLQNMGIYEPFLYDLGDTMIYFTSWILDGGYGGVDLWAIRLNNGAWSAPWNLGPEINSGDNESSISMTRDRSKIYFLRDTIIMTSNSINGEYTTPTAMPDIINNPITRNRNPRISPDGLRFYFNQERTPLNPSPLFVSNFIDRAWQEPVQLNRNINFYNPDPDCDLVASESAEASFTPDGAKMYFSHFEVVGSLCEPSSDIYVSELLTGIDNENPETPSTLSLTAYPNPFNAQTRIVYAGDIGELNDIAIYSITGQKLKSFAPASEIMWDGADMRGNNASSGLYFVVASGNNHRAVAKVTLLR